MQNVRQFFNKDIVSLTAIHRRYNNELYKILPPQLTGQCYVASISEYRIVITVPSPSIANHLRYLQTDVKKRFSLLCNRPITEMTLKVSPKQLENKDLTPPVELSNQAASSLKSLASAVEDPQLKNSLIKLSQKAKN